MGKVKDPIGDDFIAAGLDPSAFVLSKASGKTVTYVFACGNLGEFKCKVKSGSWSTPKQKGNKDYESMLQCYLS